MILKEVSYAHEAAKYSKNNNCRAQTQGRVENLKAAFILFNKIKSNTNCKLNVQLEELNSFTSTKRLNDQQGTERNMEYIHRDNKLI